MTKLMRMGVMMTAACLIVSSATGTAVAWHRGHVETFAVLPDYAPGVPESAEGLAVGLDGNIYVPSGGFNADGPVPGPAKLWVFDPQGRLIRTVTLTGTAPPVLGIAFNPANGLAFIADFGNQSVFKWDPASNTTKLVAFLGAGAAPNAICFDASGNVYISDSFNGAIWRTDKNGNNLTQWLPSNPLLIPASGLNPPFGANGIEFNNEHTAMFVANTANRTITRIAVAFEAGRDGFWLARWLEARGVEAHVIHPSSVAVSREHRRAKTDRLDTELLKRGFLGWLRGERGHCSMARVPTIAEEDAKRPNRERECLVKERTRLANRMKGALAGGAWGRGARDPSLECGRVAGTSPGQDRSARHRVAEARVPGVAAWRTGPLQHGARSDDCRRGRQAAQSGARVPGQGTHPACQPHEGHPSPARHS